MGIIKDYIINLALQVKGKAEFTRTLTKATYDVLKFEREVKKLAREGKTPSSEQFARAATSFMSGMGYGKYGVRYDPRTGRYRWIQKPTPASMGIYAKTEEVPREARYYGTSFLRNWTRKSEQLVEQNKELARNTDLTKKNAEAQSILGRQLLKNLKHSAMIVPVWFAVRQVFMLAIRTVGDLAGTFMRLDDEMGRVGTVTGDVVKGNKEELETLRKAVLDYSSTASRGFKESASVMYAIGSAGLKVKGQLSALNAVMDLSIGTFSSAERNAKLVAGMYNVFKDSIKGTYTEMTKFRKIADVLAYTYAKQQIELSELSGAMQYVSAVASLMHINLDELVTTIGVLNTGMLKGTKSGRNLMSAFSQIAAKGKGLEKLGIYFDASKPLDFLKVMERLHEIYGSQKLDLDSMRKFMDVFGLRGARPVLLLLKRYEEWQKAIKDTKSTFKDFATYMRLQAEDTLPKAFKKLWNSIKAGGVESLGGLGNWIKQGLKEDQIIDVVKRIRSNPKISRYWKEQFNPERFGILPGYNELLGVSYIIPANKINEAYKKLYLTLSKFQEEQNLEKQYELYAKQKEALSGINFSVRSTAELLDKIAKHSLNITDEKEREEFIEKQLYRIAKYRFMVSANSTEDIKKKVKFLKEQLEISGKIEKAQKPAYSDALRALNTRQKELDVQRLKILGYRDEEVRMANIKRLVDEINKAIIEANKLSGNDKDKIKLLDIDEIGNKQRIAELQGRILSREKELNKVYEEGNELLNDRLKEIEGYSNKLQSALSGGLSSWFSGEKTFGQSFKEISKTFRSEQLKSLTEGLSETLFRGTGLGRIFGSTTYKIRRAFDYGANKVYMAIVSGFNAGTGRRTYAMGGFGGIISGSAVGNFGGIEGTGFTLPGFGQGGFFNRYIPTGYSRRLRLAGFPTEAKYASRTTYGQIFGLAANTAMAVSGGLNTGMASGIMSGLGSAVMGAANLGMFGAGTSAGMFGLGSLIPGIGLALAIGGLISGMFNKAPSWSRTETKTSTQQITSRIDVTNKQLEWVNRNLVALRRELTYIMPRSYYFSSEDNFALSALRGRM